jgi:monofunctional biosynthetic peptidoglycan transglycosylase
MQILKQILILVVAMTVIVVSVTTVQVLILQYHNPRTTAWMRMRVRQARVEGKKLPIRHQWVSISEIPRAMPLAVIAAEDEKFYEHHGFDWEALRKAYDRNAKFNRIKRGGSTITQQLAKNLYLSPGRSYIRKAREAWITMTMELLLPKNRILELYVNSVEFGPGIFGVEAAAQYHFGVSARQLSVNQCCRLAAILPAPLRYRITGNYVSRRAAILQRIVSGAPPPEETGLQPIETPKTVPPRLQEITDSLLREMEQAEKEETTSKNVSK